MAISLASLLFNLSGDLQAQPRYRQNDVVTFTDCRSVWSVDIGRREVYFATEGGVWRIERFTGEPLDPWFTGVGLEKAIRLTAGRIILWHDRSNTLWLAAKDGLYYYRQDVERWYQLDDRTREELKGARIDALGESGDSVLVELKLRELQGDSTQILAVDPFIFRVLGTIPPDKVPEQVRWVRFSRHPLKRELPRYRLTDPSLHFDRMQGVITDLELDKFWPVAESLDDEADLHYILYPGLGIGVADAIHMRLEILQPGPAGRDVKAIGPGPGGRLWVGGEDDPDKGGFNLFDRAGGRWERFDADVIVGIDSHRARDVLTIGGLVFFATDAGLVYFKPKDAGWFTLDRFDGLAGPNIRALTAAEDILFLGGDMGVNLRELQAGSIWSAGDRRVDELRTSDCVSDGDTVWIAGLQGVFRWTPEGGWEPFAGKGISGEPARSLAITRTRLWIGGRHGIREFDRRSGEWAEHPGRVFLRGGMPLSLASNDSLLWVGSDRGLFCFNRLRGSWLEYGTGQGLPHPRIQRLILEADTLWIGSPAGLTRFIWNRPERDVF